MVVRELEQDGVVHDATIRRADQHVLALLRLRGRQVPRCQQLREPGRIRSLELQLPLDGDVPQRHVIDEMPVLLHIVVTERGDQHVVVEIPARAAGLDRSLMVGRLLVVRDVVELEQSFSRSAMSIGDALRIGRRRSTRSGRSSPYIAIEVATGNRQPMGVWSSLTAGTRSPT